MKFSEFADINPTIRLNKDREYSFIEMADIQPGNRYVEPKKQKAPKGGARFNNGDTLFARITPCLENGKIAQVKGITTGAGFGSTEFYVFRGKKGVSDGDFVYYLSQSEIIRGPAEKSMSGASGRQRADIGAVSEIEIHEFDIDRQIKIAEILSKYDNLIENNNRRIAILEDMAQSLYREWFVKFRYPGHDEPSGKTVCKAESCPEGLSTKDGANEYQTLIDSPLGPIPAGWEVKAASEIISINPRTKLPKDGEKPFVPMSGLSESSMVVSDIESKAGNSGAKYINGDILFARITPCLQNGKTGYVQFLTEEQPIGFGSTEFIVLRSTETLPSEFTYLLSRSREFRENAIKSMTGATGRQRVRNECFDSFYLATPPPEILKEFTSVVKPMFESVFNLSKRTINLKKQRDMLLPKLISGKINLNGSSL